MVQFKQQFYREIGSNIKHAREKAGKTQEALAEAADTNRSTIINIERGQQQVPIHVLLAIATVLDTDPFELVPKMLSLEDRPEAQRRWIEAGFRAVTAQG